MKALSLTQPWATAMAIGVKEWETRSWPTGFRGLVAIHAAKRFPRWAKNFAMEIRHEHSLFPQHPSEWPVGCIVAVGEIKECRSTEDIRGQLSETERKWGDYGDDRYCFKFQLLRQVIPPALCKGALGFWTIPSEIWTPIQQTLTR